jgi:integrase
MGEQASNFTKEVIKMANSRGGWADGSIRKRSNRLWEGRYSYKDELTGKRVDKSVYAPTKPEARRKLKELIDKIENGVENEENVESSSLKLSDWLDTWMKEYKKNNIRPTTYSAYNQCVELHIKPAIGNVELQKLRPDHVQKLLNDLAKSGKKGKNEKEPLSPATVIKVKNVLSGALEQAIRNQLIPYNPARAAVSPKLEQKEIRILSVDDQKHFSAAVRGHRLEALYLLALATGMRRGEILALSWDSVDFNSNNIFVKGSISRIKDPDTGVTELRFSEPKTKSGKRHVPILPNMIPVLKAHKARQGEEKAKAGSAWNQKNLVFCSNVGTAIEPRRVCTTMDKIIDTAELDRVTFHALRHTFATRMLEANVPAKIVQEILGHSDVTLTLNTYSHVVGSTAHEQMARINNLFEFGDDVIDIDSDSKSKDKLDEKPSIKQQLKDSKKELGSAGKKPEKKQPEKAFGKDSHEL